MMVFAVLAACQRHGATSVDVRHGMSLQKQVPEVNRRSEGSSPALSSIDSLMWQRPDSALMCLLPYFDTCCTANDWHYANLLLAELLYKNDNPQLNRTELLQAVDYYDSLCCCRDAARNVSTDPTLIFLDARAHYINGVGYYEHDSVVEACQEYLKALEVMERFDEKELVSKKAKFMTYCYNRLGDMFSEQFMMEPAIECYNNAYGFSLIAPISSYSLSNALYRIGLQYNKLNKTDSAYYYYECALSSIPDSNNLTYRNIQSSRALLSYQMARRVEPSLKRLLEMLQLADDNEELLTRCLTIGGLYYEEKKYDSALWYLDRVFQNTSDVLSKIQAANYLCIISDSLGMDKKTNEYARFSAAVEKTSGQNKAEASLLSAKYKGYKDKKLERHNAEEKKQIRKVTRLRTIGTVATLSFLTMLLVIVVIRKRNRKRLLEKESVERLLQDANARLLAENKHLMEQETKARDFEPRKASASAYEALMRESICFDLLHRFGNTEIISTNKPSYYEKYAISARDKRNLAAVVEKHCPDFGPLLKALFPDFTRNDFELCRFLLIGLSELQVAVLLQKDYSTIWKRTRHIKDVLQTAEPEHRLRHVLFDIDIVIEE